MKYEINGFEDVFENKNLIRLREVTRSRGKQIWRAGFFMVGAGGKFYGINFTYHYYVIGAFASVYTKQ